jgi:hypothetical protein
MNLKRLQAFRAVYEIGSVTAAAQRLHMTQPAVSRLIGDLEKELGLQLFARQRQRLGRQICCTCSRQLVTRPDSAGYSRPDQGSPDNRPLNAR